jgi:hypothetical protein
MSISAPISIQYLRLTSVVVAAALLLVGCDSSPSPVTESEQAEVRANQGPGLGSAPSSAKTVYNTFEIKKSLQDVKFFLPFEQILGVDEYGDHIRFADGSRDLGEVTVGMSSRTPYSEWSDSYPANGYEHPFTLNLYKVDKSGENPAVGDLIASKTKTATVPWRPNGNQSPKCQEAGGGWGSLCWGGRQFTVTFDMSGVEGTEGLPDEIIYGIAFNTETSGNSPIGEPGPYNELAVQSNIVRGEMGRGNEDADNIAIAPDPGTNVEDGYRFLDSEDNTPEGVSLPPFLFTGDTFQRALGFTCPAPFCTSTRPSGETVGFTPGIRFDMERP